MKGRFLPAAVFLVLAGALAAGLLSCVDDIPGEAGSWPLSGNPQESAAAPQDQIEDWERRYAEPQEVVDFLSEDARQRCLEYHVFEDCNSVEPNLFQLPFAEEKVRYFSSSILCHHLIEDYYIYTRSGVVEGEDGTSVQELWEIHIVNEATEEWVWVRPETFPSVLELLTAQAPDAPLEQPS